MTELTKKQREEVDKEVDKQLAKKLKEKLAEAHDQLVTKAQKEASLFRAEFRKQTGAAIIAAFGFIIALAWKDLVVKLMEHFTKTDLLGRYPYLADLYTAIIITIFSVIGIIIISRWEKQAVNPENLPQ